MRLLHLEAAVIGLSARDQARAFEKYEMILRKHRFPTLRRPPVTAVTRDHIRTALGEKMSAEFKPKTVRGHLDVPRVGFSVAVEDHLISANPAAHLGKFVTRSRESQEVEAFTGAELTTLLERAERETPEDHSIVLTLAAANRVAADRLDDATGRKLHATGISVKGERKMSEGKVQRGGAAAKVYYRQG